MKFYFVHFEHLKELQRDLFKFNQLCIATPTLYRHMVGLLNKWIHTFCFMILSGSARNSSFVWVDIFFLSTFITKFKICLIGTD